MIYSKYLLNMRVLNLFVWVYNNVEKYFSCHFLRLNVWKKCVIFFLNNWNPPTIVSSSLGTWSGSWWCSFSFLIIPFLNSPPWQLWIGKGYFQENIFKFEYAQKSHKYKCCVNVCIYIRKVCIHVLIYIRSEMSNIQPSFVLLILLWPSLELCLETLLFSSELNFN